MSTAHTPGPWHFAPCANSVSYAQVDCADGTTQGRLAASIFHGGEDCRPMIRIGAPTDNRLEVIANAHLVAAAPDLLKALEECRDDLAHYVRTHGPGPDRRLAAVDAAIRKARGQS